MATKPVYVGFNTVGRISPPFTLTDIELVKQDISNTFHTRKGERLMMPTFGSNIPLYMMDPFDTITEKAIIDDAINVISQDPRVELVNISSSNTLHSMTLTIILFFLPNRNPETLYVEFKRQMESAI